MHKKNLHCIITTPILCHGENESYSELRAPSLKGCLRYWWRAIHADLSLEDLRKKEGEIFGGTEKKASFSLQIVNIKNERTIKQTILPHDIKKSNFSKDALTEPTEFSVIISSYEEAKIKMITNLLVLLSVLGGIGGRSRRGLGCFKIKSVENIPQNDISSEEQILTLIREINPHFSYENSLNSQYPTIERIEIGKNGHFSFNSLFLLINQSAHECDSEYTGYAKGSRRYASPIYVSIIEKNNQYYPIITTLKRTIYGQDQRMEDRKNNFITKILRGW
jgi:CRISPR-associated protein Cmr1